jgi:acetyltransferase-like isoleucine patch superfamily enzyme
MNVKAFFAVVMSAALIILRPTRKEAFLTEQSHAARRVVARLDYYWRRMKLRVLLLRAHLLGPPRILMYDSETNAVILRAFGAKIGTRNVRVHAPLVLHGAEDGYANLIIGDGCILNGNVYLDLSGKITLEQGTSLGPGSIVMTHNRFNYNTILEERLAHQCGVADVLLKVGSAVKAGVILTKGVTIGANSVVAAGAVVTHDVESLSLVAGIPAKVIRRIE